MVIYIASLNEPKKSFVANAGKVFGTKRPIIG